MAGQGSSRVWAIRCPTGRAPSAGPSTPRRPHGKVRCSSWRHSLVRPGVGCAGPANWHHLKPRGAARDDDAVGRGPTLGHQEEVIIPPRTRLVRAQRRPVCGVKDGIQSVAGLRRCRGASRPIRNRGSPEAAPGTAGRASVVGTRKAPWPRPGPRPTWRATGRRGSPPRRNGGSFCWSR